MHRFLVLLPLGLASTVRDAVFFGAVCSLVTLLEQKPFEDCYRVG